MKKVQLITDGACLGNPGPGGWAAVLRFNELKKEIWNSQKHTTNNRMELTAAIEGLKSLKEQCEVEVVTDSEYVKNGITTWIHGWKRKGWLTAAKRFRRSPPWPLVRRGRCGRGTANCGCAKGTG